MYCTVSVKKNMYSTWQNDVLLISMYLIHYKQRNTQQKPTVLYFIHISTTYLQTNTVLSTKNIQQKHTMLFFLYTFLSCTGSQTHILCCPRKHTFFISMYCIKLTSAQACILLSPKHTQCKNNAVHNLFISHKQVFYPRKINNVNTLRVHIHRSSMYLLSVKNRPAKHNSILLLYVTLMSSPAIIRLSQKN